MVANASREHTCSGHDRKDKTRVPIKNRSRIAGRHVASFILCVIYAVLHFSRTNSRKLKCSRRLPPPLRVNSNGRRMKTFPLKFLFRWFLYAVARRLTSRAIFNLYGSTRRTFRCPELRWNFICLSRVSVNFGLTDDRALFIRTTARR